MKIIWIYIFFLSVILSKGTLAEDSNLNSYQFLNSQYSPRLVALGGIYPTISGDLNALFGNPAGLGNMNASALKVTYTNSLLDFNGGFLGYHQPVSQKINLSFGLLYMDYGSFEKVDNFALTTGENFESRDLALLSSASGRVFDRFSLGITLKYIYSKISNFSATALAADMGLLADVPYFEDFVFGLNLKNFGKTLDPYDQTKEELPLVFSLGFTKYFFNKNYAFYLGWNQLPFYTRSNDKLYQNFAIGLESKLNSLLTIRVGYNNFLRENLRLNNSPDFLGISGGFALRFGSQELAYGYSNFGDIGQIHIFGFTYSFSKGKYDAAQSKKIGEEDVSFNITEIPSPYRLQYNVVSDKLLISWSGFEGLFYNIYAKHGEKQAWTKMNSQPIRDNFISFKKPEISGTYYFTVTSVYQNQESYFSEQLKIIIE